MVVVVVFHVSASTPLQHFFDKKAFFPVTVQGELEGSWRGVGEEYQEIGDEPHDEQRATSKEQRATSKEQRAKSNEQRATSKEQRANRATYKKKLFDLTCVIVMSCE
ncbi:hypothetical protein H4K35_15360 [Myroides sp. NP-2]|uniref:hypothetical protein n=1 Tax=Myroides sp. NP-2 TaxID=2759945 RepID=UPI0015F88904|nr:hypothetical protein [Myroides sp. NP-2]MBB1151464.1 hypothetical protein [Myroides sp. NP-2]